MMQAGVDGYVLDIAETVSRDLGNVLDVSSTRPIGRPASKADVRDATLAFLVDGKIRRHDIVLLVSNPSFPDTVKEDTDKARAVAELLDPATAHHVITPLRTGRHDRQTYAAFPRLAPLSEHRVLRYPQKRRMAPAVAAWLASVAMQTRIVRTAPEDVSRYFIEPLQGIAGDAQVPAEARAHADRCLDVVSNNPPSPLFTTVEHGDFWIGNVLLEPGRLRGARPLPRDFFVIDWRGARQDGYPCMDIVRFCLSIHKVGSAHSDRLLGQYRERLGITPFEMALYCTVSLGRLGMALDHFPRERFQHLLRNVFSVLTAHGLTEFDR